jgi:hypothetical protein
MAEWYLALQQVGRIESHCCSCLKHVQYENKRKKYRIHYKYNSSVSVCLSCVQNSEKQIIKEKEDNKKRNYICRI